MRLCPGCDGFDVKNQRVAVLGTIEDALPHALFMRTYTADLTLLTPEQNVEVSNDARCELRNAGIHLSEGPIDRIFLREDLRLSVRMASGEEHDFDTVYPTLGCHVRGGLATAMGASCDENGDVVVDDHQRTSIPVFTPPAT